MKKFSFYFALLFIALLFTNISSCKKDDGLPKATQSGENTMGAKINGKEWKSGACWTCINGGSGLKAVYGDDRIGIDGDQTHDNTDIYISLTVNRIAGQMTYNFDSKFPNNSARLFDFKSNKTYYTSASSTGTVTFTKIDTGNKIISGNFSFQAENKDDPNDIINVTDGRFDVKY